MSYNTWLIAGVLFLALELVLPGGVAGAIGLSTLMIALLIWMGWLTEFLVAIGLWLVLVTISLLIIRKIIRRFSPNQTSVGVVNEDETLRGTNVLVTESIPLAGSGRVMIRGTSWLATFVDPNDSIEAGASVQLVYRENIRWFVKKIPDNPKGEIL